MRMMRQKPAMQRRPNTPELACVICPGADVRRHGNVHKSEGFCSAAVCDSDTVCAGVPLAPDFQLLSMRVKVRHTLIALAMAVPRGTHTHRHHPCTYKDHRVASSPLSSSCSAILPVSGMSSLWGGRERSSRVPRGAVVLVQLEALLAARYVLTFVCIRAW